MLSAQQVYGGGKEGVTVSYRINIGDMECGESRGEREDGSIHVRTGKKMVGTGWCLV